MAAVVEVAEDEHFQQQPEGQRRRQRQHETQPEAAAPGGQRGHQIGAHHVLHAVREIDEVHDAEDERQPRRDEEQDQAELETVQHLHEEERGRHAGFNTTALVIPGHAEGMNPEPTTG